MPDATATDWGRGPAAEAAGGPGGAGGRGGASTGGLAGELAQMLGPNATADDLREARRRLARRLHPDLVPAGEGRARAAALLADLNAEIDRRIEALRAPPTRGRSTPAAGDDASHRNPSSARPSDPPNAPTAPAASPSPTRRGAVGWLRPSGEPERVHHDLGVVASWLGRPGRSAPPAWLEVALDDPARTPVLLRVHTDAISTLVSVTIPGHGPDADRRAAEVADRVATALRSLER